MEHSGVGGELEVVAVSVCPTKLEGECDAVQELISGAQVEKRKTCKNQVKSGLFWIVSHA